MARKSATPAVTEAPELEPIPLPPDDEEEEILSDPLISDPDDAAPPAGADLDAPPPLEMWTGEDEEGAEAQPVSEPGGQPQDTEEGAEPWSEDPATFDFRTIADPVKRQAAFVRFANQHPDLAHQRDMLYEDYNRTKQQAAEREREFRQMEKELAELRGRLDGMTKPAAEDDEVAKATSMLYAFSEQFQAKHGREPTVAEYTQWAVKENLQPVLKELDDLKAERQRDADHQEQSLKQMVNSEWNALLVKYPVLNTDEAQNEVATTLSGISAQRQARGQSLQPGDVEKAFRIAYGDTIAKQREEAARSQQRVAAQATPSLQPSGPGRTPPAGPKSTRIEDIEAYQRQAGMRGLLSRVLNR